METRNFNQVASTWDENPGRVKLANDVGQSMLNNLTFNPGMNVLDFGCGTGLVTLKIQSFVKSVMALDTSQGMLDILRLKIEKTGIKNVKLTLLDLEKGEKIQGRYHSIVSSMALHHVPDTAALLSKFHSLLEPGGVLALADLDPEGGLFHEDNTGVFHQGFDRGALARLYVQSGFEKVQDWTAAKVEKKTPQGEKREFTVFLLAGTKN